MLVPGTSRRVFAVDVNAGIAVTGYGADGRQIVTRAREESKSYKDTYGHRIVPAVLASRVAMYMHYFTLYQSLRPFGAAALIAAYDEDVKRAELYMVDPSGTCHRFFGCATGKGTNAAKTELEKLLTKSSEMGGMTCMQAVNELAKM